jgi:hypothetical protein
MLGMAPFVAVAAYVQIKLVVASFTQIAVGTAAFFVISGVICLGCMLIDGVVLASQNQRDDSPKKE